MERKKKSGIKENEKKIGKKKKYSGMKWKLGANLYLKEKLRATFWTILESICNLWEFKGQIIINRSERGQIAIMQK